MMAAFTVAAVGLCFWLAFEACILMLKKTDVKYGWISLAFFAFGAFGLYSLIVGK